MPVSRRRLELRKSGPVPRVRGAFGGLAGERAAGSKERRTAYGERRASGFSATLCANDATTRPKA